MEKDPLELLEKICAEIYERWDKDMRSGKLLQALSGALPGYRADVDAVRAAFSRITPRLPRGSNPSSIFGSAP